MAGMPIGEEAIYRVRGKTYATYFLIAVNVILYILSSWRNGLISSSSEWIRLGGFVPALLVTDPSSWVRIFTSMFLHANIIHIFFNMYFLYIFGRPVERTIGSSRYLALYIASGVFATVFHTAFSYLQGVDSFAIPAVGASGAISGVLGAYAILFPGTKLYACFWIFLIPVCYTMYSLYFMLFWFGFQVLNGYATMSSMAPVAFFAHAGGFLAGIGILLLVVDKIRLSYLRREVELKNIYGVILYPYNYFYRKGLGKTAKTIFSILIIAVLAGASYSLLSSFTEQSLVGSSEIYVETATLPLPSIGYIVYTYRADTFEVVETSLATLAPDEARILFNRLYYAGLFYNPKLANQELVISDTTYTASVEVCNRRVPVIVYVEELVGRYNEEGLLVEARGVIHSPVIRVQYLYQGVKLVCRYQVTDPQTMVFTLRTSDPLPISQLAIISGYASVAISLLALFTVIARDEELVVTPIK